jgi:hypothetical protein
MPSATFLLLSKSERKIAADTGLQQQCLNINKDFQFLIVMEELMGTNL